MQSSEAPLKFFSAWFCPYAQRTWIGLEVKKIDYEIIESLSVTPEGVYKKNPELLKNNPRGLVPTLLHIGNPVYESALTLDYLEEAFPDTPSIFPKSPFEKWKGRLAVINISKQLIPSFYKVLQLRGEQQATAVDAYKKSLKEFVGGMDSQGPFYFGAEITYVDICIAP